MPQIELHVGIDVSKERLDIAWYPHGETFSVGNDRPGWRSLRQRLAKPRLALAAVGVEASGGYERGVLEALTKAGLPVRLINPFRLRQFAKALGIMAKNDRLDAGVIARSSPWCRAAPRHHPTPPSATCASW